MATDAEIRAAGLYAVPKNKYLQNEFQLPTNEVVEEETESFGIPNTNAFTNSGGNNYTGGYNFGNTGFQQAVDARQRNLNKPTDTSTFMGRTMGTVRDFIEPQSASQIMTDGYQEPRFQPGIIGTIMGKMDNYRNLPQADQAFIAQNMGYTGPTVFGENNSGLGKDMYGINTRSMFGNYANYVDKMEADYSDIDEAAYAKLSKFQRQKIDFYRGKKKESDALKMQEELAKEERDRGIQTIQQRIDKEYKDSGGGGFNKSNDPTGSKEKGFNMHGDGKMADGGRAGYFFGGRVNYKAGGRTDAGANRTTASKAGVGQINESGQKVSGGNYNNNDGGNNLSSTVDINKAINKKITSMIPDRVDKNQLLFDNAKRYQTLSKNKNSPFFMNRSNGPKTINKNLYTNNLTDLSLQYPDINIKNEYGMIDGNKAKSLIDQAVVEQTISPVEGLNLTRSIDTTGTQSNTSGNYTMGNFNFNSPNIEQGILNSRANYNLGDLNLNAGVNTNDSTINDSKLGFNYGDGALTGSTYRDNDYGYTTNKLGVDKQFDIGNNFKVGLDGSYQEDKFKDGSYYNADLKPSLTYNDGTFNANLSKEIVEGGTQPNLGIGFQKNNFYANANNLLSQDPTGTIGYQRNIGSSDGPLQFSAGGEMDPFTGQKTAGLYGTYTYKNGGLAGLL